MKKKQFVQVRFETRVNEKKYIYEMKHNLRQWKNIPNQINNNENLIYYENKTLKYNNETNVSKLKEITNKLLENSYERVRIHKKLFKKTKKRTLETSKQKSLNGGVLTFSDSIMEKWEQNPYKVWEYGVKTIKNMCKELDTQLHYVVLHTDEKGLIHFQFGCDNFDSKGIPLGIQRNKQKGKLVQDLSEKYFKKMGFSRGISKDKSNKRHLTIQQFKEYKENLEKVKEYRDIVLRLETQITEKETQIEELKIKYFKMKKQFSNIQKEYREQIEKLYNEVIEIYEIEDSNKFIRLLERYVNSKKKIRLERFIEKHSKIVEKLKKKQKNTEYYENNTYKSNFEIEESKEEPEEEIEEETTYFGM